MDLSSINDERLLLSLVAEGNEKAFKALFDHFGKRVYNKALVILKNPVAAEDVIQEVFIRLWINREKANEIRDLDAYLNVLTRNHVLNLLRRQAYHEKFIGYVMSEGLMDDGDIPDNQQIIDFHNKINNIVSSLPAQQKRVYELSRSEGMKHSEIAKQLGISAETVKKHISEALKTLKKQLACPQNLILFFSFMKK